ncbi:MAG: hypothetical protein DRZ76_02120 [Candidatus Nealsonbacteria bacterium]|nr:MAG: hypothetical protein DRZ76_02120 [Candidatus Nealsonbacteria bacterium]
MSRLLTKEEILRGTNKTEKVFIKELGGEIEIRPLNEEQWAEIEAKIGIDIDFDVVYDKDGKPDIEKTKQNFKMKLDVEQIQKIEFEKLLLACKYGMTMGIKEEELRKISPPGIVKKIANAVFKISEVSEDQLKELKMFRE